MIPPGRFWTKETRRAFFGENGKSIRFEIWQRDMIEIYTRTSCHKSNNIRIHEEDYTLCNPSNLGSKRLRYTENFDGIQEFGENTVYINLKMICESGGAQARSIKDVYGFVKSQMEFIDTIHNTGNIYFANILDGEYASSFYNEFELLITKDGLTDSYAQRIYVGDLKGYIEWLKERHLIKHIMSIQVKKLHEDSIIPTKATDCAVGWDLPSYEELVIPSGEHALVKTGLAMRVPDYGMYGRIAPRSGLAVKKGIHVGAGVIDPDYRGEIGVVLFNFGKEPFEIKKGDRIAQFVVEIYSPHILEVVETLDDTERGEKGFGSSGI